MVLRWPRCDWLYLIMQLPSDKSGDWYYLQVSSVCTTHNLNTMDNTGLPSPASDVDCNLIRPIKKSFVKLDTLTELNRTRREKKNNLPLLEWLCGLTSVPALQYIIVVRGRCWRCLFSPTAILILWTPGLLPPTVSLCNIMVGWTIIGFNSTTSYCWLCTALQLNIGISNL